MARDKGRHHAGMAVVWMALLLLGGCSSIGHGSHAAGDSINPAALMAAVQANADRDVLNLLTRGVDPDQQTVTGQTPLMVAAANGNRRIVRLLLAAGAQVNAQDAAGYTPVIHAAEQGHLTVVRALLAAGANVNVNQDGESLLMKVVGSGDLLTAEVLLAAGADVRYRAPDGRTALSVAQASRNPDLEMLLVQAGAAR